MNSADNFKRYFFGEFFCICVCHPKKGCVCVVPLICGAKFSSIRWLRNHQTTNFLYIGINPIKFFLFDEINCYLAVYTAWI